MPPTCANRTLYRSAAQTCRPSADTDGRRSTFDSARHWSIASFNSKGTQGFTRRQCIHPHSAHSKADRQIWCAKNSLAARPVVAPRSCKAKFPLGTKCGWPMPTNPHRQKKTNFARHAFYAASFRKWQYAARVLVVRCPSPLTPLIQSSKFTESARLCMAYTEPAQSKR